MAKAEVDIKIKLELSREECEFICGLTQNHLGGDAPESKEVREIRESIFHATNIGDTYRG